jgi:hypothetical protein
MEYAGGQTDEKIQSKLAIGSSSPSHGRIKLAQHVSNSITCATQYGSESLTQTHQSA